MAISPAYQPHAVVARMHQRMLGPHVAVAPALGMDKAASRPEQTGEKLACEALEAAIWSQLKQVFDPAGVFCRARLYPEF